MDFRDIMRSFMGFSRDPNYGNSRDMLGEQPLDDTEEEEFDRFPHHGGSHFFTEPGDMFRHFEQHFEEMFRNFGMMDFPSMREIPVEPGETDISEMPQESIRDKMLKPGYGASSHSGNKVDSDLDDRIDAEDLKDLFPQPSSPHIQPSPPHNPIDDELSVMPRSFGHSMSIRTIIGSNGKVEEYREHRDSSGRNETSISRRLGDQKHSVTTRRNQDGTEEKTEDFVNIDEESLNNFDQRWQSSHSDYSDRHGTRQGSSFFSRLFPF